MGVRGDNPLRVLVIAASSARRAQLASLVTNSAVGKIMTSASASLDRIVHSSPDVVIVDADTETIAETAITIAEELPGPAGMAVLIDHPGTQWTARALDAGIHAILSRAALADDLHLAMIAAQSGLVLLHPTSAASLVRQTLSRSASPMTPEKLTTREQEILGLLSEGLGNKEIATRLNISDHTVKFHISSILGKLNAASRTEAVSQGIRRGWIAI